MVPLAEDPFPKCILGPTRLFPKKPLSQKHRFGDETLYFEIQSLFSKFFLELTAAFTKKVFGSKQCFSKNAFLGVKSNLFFNLHFYARKKERVFSKLRHYSD